MRDSRIHFSFTNGLFSSLGNFYSRLSIHPLLAMVYGQEAAPERVRGQVGRSLGTTLIGGQLFGALLSFAMVPLAKVL